MNTRKLRKILLTLCSALLLVSLSVGMTIAYLSDTTDVVKNTFTTGKVTIKLDEAAVKQDDNGNYVVDTEADPKRVTKNDYTMYPGGTYVKDPTITIEANSEDCYVAAKVILTTGTDLTELIPVAADNEDFIGFGELVKGGVIADTANGTVTMGNELVIETEAVKLVQKKATASGDMFTREFLVFYKTPVAKSNAAQTKVLFESIELPKDWNNDEVAKLNNMNIEITAYAVQEAGMAGCEDAMTKAGYIQ